MALLADRSSRWIALAVIAAGALAWRFAEPLDLRKDRSFEIAEDPHTKVIEVQYVGGRTHRLLIYEIFGDGRLVCSRDRYPPGRETPPEILFEERLSRTELLAVFEDLTRYRQRVAGPSGSIRFQIALGRLLFSIREFPEVKELAAVGRLLDRFETIRRSKTT